jgi:predicted porin
MYNDKNSVIGGVGLLVANDERAAPGLTIGIGAKAVAATLKELPTRKNVSAIALGAQVRYELPVERRVAFAGEFYYAPEIISFGDAKHYQQYGARAEFSVSPQMQVYAGYRKTQFNVKPTSTDVALINGPHVGVQLSF